MSRTRKPPPLICGKNAVGISLRSWKREASGRRRTREREARARIREGHSPELATHEPRTILWHYW